MTTSVHHDVRSNTLGPNSGLPAIIGCYRLCNISGVAIGQTVRRVARRNLIADHHKSNACIGSATKLPNGTFFRNGGSHTRNFACRRHNRGITSIICSFSVIGPPTRITARLKVTRSSFTCRVIHMHRISNLPVIVRCACVPLRLVPNLGGGSLCKSICDCVHRRYKLGVSDFRHAVHTITTARRRTRHLGAEPNSPLLRLGRVNFLSDNTTFRCSVSHGINSHFRLRGMALTWIYGPTNTHFRPFYTTPTRPSKNVRVSSLVGLAPVFRRGV